MSVLENAKFNINYSKTKPLDIKHLEETYEQTEEDVENQYNPFQIRDLQNYNPIYSQFFELTQKNYNTISLNNKYQIQDMKMVCNPVTKEVFSKDVFIKYSPLLDPIRYMIGKYDINDNKIRTLPTLSGEAVSHPKMLDYNNTSYVDNFFSYLASKLLHHHGMHCVDYFGSFLGIQDNFKMDVADDLEYLQSSDFFNDNLGKHFTINLEPQCEFMNLGSRSNKIKLNISNTNEDNISIIDLECEQLDDLSELNVTSNGDELIYENTKIGNKSESSSSHGSSSNSDVNDSSDDDDDDNSHCIGSDENEDGDGDEESSWETTSSSDEFSDVSEEEHNYAYIKKFPMQMICLEKCDGTMDELFVKQLVDDINGSSMLFQVIMSLIVFQKAFQFTHNDLHTNNVMYTNTDIKYIYYKYKNKYYAVPTYGKIFKVIDFGRSIYKFKGKQFCSDSFAKGGDAATQYNFEPYMNENKARLEPNFSFDLCRLGTSIYDFILDIENVKTNMGHLQETINRWCIDDNDKNVLYKKNGEERYPNFKLYKMIARTVHNHTPQEQLKFEYFNAYEVKKIEEENAKIIDIDAIPSYV